MLSRKRKYDELIELNDDASPWNYLPDVPLINLYSYLSWKDRANASQVCKSWSQAFGAACNWREANIYFTGKSHVRCFNSRMKFVTKFSHLLHDVRIHYRCDVVDDDEAEMALIRFRSMCRVLAEKAQLTSLLLDNLDFYFENTDADFKMAIMDCIVSLLNSQNKLQTLHFLCCGFNHKDLTKLFSAVGKGNPLSMIRNYEEPSTEDMDDIDEDNVSDDEDADYVGYEEEIEEISDDYENENGGHWFCNCLENLKIWDTNYSPSLEILVSNFAAHLKKCHLEDGKKVRSALKCMQISWTGWFKNFRGISEGDWESFCAIFPNLKVDFDICTSENDIDPKFVMRFLLRRNMPLRSLTFIVDDSLRSGYEPLNLDVLLNHLDKCQLHSRIETLRIDNFVLQNTSSIVSPRQWSNLEYLSIRISHPLNHLERVLKRILKECPKRLKRLHVNINEASTSAEDEMMVKIVEQFKSKFLRKEVTFTIDPAYNDD